MVGWWDWLVLPLYTIGARALKGCSCLELLFVVQHKSVAMAGLLVCVMHG